MIEQEHKEIVTYAIDRAVSETANAYDKLVQYAINKTVAEAAKMYGTQIAHLEEQNAACKEFLASVLRSLVTAGSDISRQTREDVTAAQEDYLARVKSSQTLFNELTAEAEPLP